MNPIFRILQFTRRFWKWYLCMGVFVISTSLLSLAGPLFSKQIVDIIVANLEGNSQNLSKIIIFLGLILLTDFLMTTLTAFGQWTGDMFGEILQTYLSRKFFQQILNLHIGFFDNQITGQISNKMYRGIQSITNFLQNMMNNFLPFFLTAFITILLLAYYSLEIAILLGILFPLYIAISHRSTKAWGSFEGKKNPIRDLAQGRVFESISAIRIVKSFGTQKIELNSFLDSRHQIEDLAKEQTRQWHFYDFLRRLALNVILFAIFTYVIYWTFHGRFSIGEMTLLIQLVNQARFPLFAMSFILGQIQEASSGSKDFFDLLSHENHIKDIKNAKQIEWGQVGTKTPIIEFENVDFEYESGKGVLENISFSIKRGEKFALVGESGEGKSTIANLIMRFYDAKKGVVKINGLDVKTVSQDSLRAQIAVVLQESLLFSGSILENIKYGKPDATLDQVISAARAANAHEFIEKLTGGYQSVIGERGVKLSGGQKQRISIARAILKDAPIIILDEATSALDSKSELKVQKGLDALLKDRTSIIIAHRLSTIANADHLLVLSQGKVAQAGAPQDLVKDKAGLYAKLISLQSALLKKPSASREKALKAFDLVG